MSEVYAL